MIMKSRNSSTFYTDYEIKIVPNGIPEAAKPVTYAPYYITNEFLPKNILSEIRGYVDELDKKTYKGSVIGLDQDKSAEYNYRNSDIFFIKDREFDKFNDYVVSRVEEINKNIFNLDLQTYMHPQYTLYSEGQYFNWHPDGPFGVMDRRGFNCIPDDLMWRKLSLSIALNDESEYEGGDFQIVNGGANPECNAISTVRMEAGASILFPAFAAHRVTPVTKGKRKTLIYWFCGPRWR